MRWVAAGAALLVTAIVLASFIPFLRPTHDRLGPFEAVVVLSGDRGERIDRALELMNRQPRPVLVLAGNPDISIALGLCDNHPAFEVVCLRPQPDNTRSEARAVAELSQQRGWDHLVVVTSTPHVTRSRLLFRRCVKGSVVGIAASPPYGWATWVEAVRHEWLGTADALTLDRGC